MHWFLIAAVACPQPLNITVLGVPPRAEAPADTILYADTLDLECTGQPNLVATIVPRDGRRPLFVVYRKTATEWARILVTPTLSDGPEEVVVAADLSGSGKRDLVTIGGDEGGYTVRIFRWSGQTLKEVPVPGDYRIREEADWGPDCMRRINPVALHDRRIRLLRETISPEATTGHGASCALPADTLRLVGGSLVRVH